MWRFISSWLGFYSEPFLGSFPDTKTATKILFLTLQEVLELLASAFECSHWLLCTTPSRQCWVEQVSWGVRKWHLRTYWFIITHRRVKLTTRDVSGIPEGKMALPFSSCLFFLIPISSPLLKLLNHLVEGCVCVTQRCPLAPQILVHSLWINIF